MTFSVSYDIFRAVGNFSNSLTEECIVEEKKKFVPFHFEGNQAWGKIQSLDDWARVLLAYSKPGARRTSAELMSLARATFETGEVENGTRVAPLGYIPNFGLYQEHDASLTLEVWAKKNGMFEVLS